MLLEVTINTHNFLAQYGALVHHTSVLTKVSPEVANSRNTPLTLISIHTVECRDLSSVYSVPSSSTLFGTSYCAFFHALSVSILFIRGSVTAHYGAGAARLPEGGVSRPQRSPPGSAPVIHVLYVHVVPILGQGNIKINIGENKPVALSIVVLCKESVRI